MRSAVKLSACLALVTLCLPFVGCSQDAVLRFYGYDRDSLLKRSLPAADEALARNCVNLLLQNRFDELEGRLDPGLKTANISEKLAEMSSYFPTEPLSVKTVEAGVVHGRDFSVTNITLEYQFLDGWLLAHISIRTKADVKTITTFRVAPIQEPFEVTNEFTFDNKGLSQYAGLLLAVSVVAVTLYAFVLCVRMSLGGAKFFWLVAILAGVCQITVNWTTGEWTHNLLSLSLRVLPVTASFSAYGPWMLQIWSPLGAIVFLRLRKRLVPQVLLRTAPGEELASDGPL